MALSQGLICTGKVDFHLGTGVALSQGLICTGIVDFH